MFVVGMNPYEGLYTKAQRNQGKGAAPGTRASIVAPSGETKEFVAVKLSAATWINGIAVILDGLSASGVGAPVATASAQPSPLINARVGIVVFASASATSTQAGTAFGWAQIYGQVLAMCSVGPSAPGLQMGIGASGQLIQQVAASASSALQGITSVATASTTTGTAGLLTVMLTYPSFAGIPA